jgi:hypothetical protein
MCIGWLDGRQTMRWRCVTTGSAYFSAMRPSGPIASAPLAVVMIKGFSALAIHSASVAISNGSACGMAGTARGFTGPSGSGIGAASGSRGSER